MQNVVYAIPSEKEPKGIYIPLDEPIRSDDPEAGKKILALLDGAPAGVETVTFRFSTELSTFNVTMPASPALVARRLADFYRDQVLEEHARRLELAAS